MSTSAVRLRRHLLASLAAAGLVCPTMASADEIRLLFVPSPDAGPIDARVRRLERAIVEGQGPLAVAESLSDAHVVVQFTEYRRSIGEKGEPLLHWVGQAKLLKQPAQMTVSATPLPERFEFVVIGEEGREELRAVQLLERMLSKTLRPRARKPTRETI